MQHDNKTTYATYARWIWRTWVVATNWVWIRDNVKFNNPLSKLNNGGLLTRRWKFDNLRKLWYCDSVSCDKVIEFVNHYFDVTKYNVSCLCYDTINLPKSNMLCKVKARGTLKLWGWVYPKKRRFTGSDKIKHRMWQNKEKWG